MVSGGAAKDLPKLFEGLRKQVQKRQLNAAAGKCETSC